MTESVLVVCHFEMPYDIFLNYTLQFVAEKDRFYMYHNEEYVLAFHILLVLEM